MANGPVVRAGDISHPLYRPVTIVGRRGRDWRLAPDLDLGPLDRRHTVSRRHAQLSCDGNAVYLRDLDSTNGTAVNGERLPPMSAIRVRDGDQLTFAGVDVRFEAEGRWPEGLVAQWEPRTGQVDAEPPAAITLPGPRGAVYRARRSRSPWSRLRRLLRSLVGR
jgi:predicted component of type VI protein secretion system